MKVLCIFVSLVVAVRAGYHEEIGIPLAARIKTAEDKVITEEPTLDNKILGEIAPLNAHPYLAGLLIRMYRTNQTSVCGSSVVTANRLLTAAHCMEGAGVLKAVLGSQYLFYEGTRITTSQYAVHPWYNLRHSLDNDIAVVYLPETVRFSATIQPISLPATQDDVEIVGEWAIATGYGKTSDSTIQPTRTQDDVEIAGEWAIYDRDIISVIVQDCDESTVSNYAQIGQVRVQIIAETSCSRNPGLNICTSGYGGVGTCGGDSGGPLVIERYGRRILVGITSYGDLVCGAGKPAAFTRVATYLGFIQQHIY